MVIKDYYDTTIIIFALSFVLVMLSSEMIDLDVTPDIDSHWFVFVVGGWRFFQVKMEFILENIFDLILLSFL